MIIPYRNPRETGAAQDKVGIRSVSSMAFAVIIQSVDLTVGKRNAVD